MGSKSESTAVNELIDLARNSKRIDDADDDFMFRAPPIPSIATPAAGSAAVRMMTAPPARMTTIPPLPGAAAAPPPMLKQTLRAAGAPPALPIKDRPTRPSLPPPTPPARASRRAEGTPAPELFTKTGAQLPPLPKPRTTAPQMMPVAAPFEPPAPPPPAPPVLPIAPPPVAAKPELESSWFEPSRMMEKVEDENWGDTIAVERQEAPARRFDWTKAIAPALILGLAGVFVGGYFAFDGERANHPKVAAAAPAPAPAPAAVAAAAPAPAPAPAAEPAAAPAPAPAAEPAVAVAAPVAAAPTSKFVDVRFDSAPSGATVMLVADGKTSFVGKTPIDASVDASHAYDVVFTLENHPTVMQHVDPSLTNRVVVQLPGPTKAVEAPKTVAVEQPKHAVVEQPKHVAEQPRPTHDAGPTKLKLADPFETKPEAKEAKKAETGTGVLMVSSKPPCAILVDGKATGLSTPQRAMSLPAGAHHITLVNKDAHIEKTFDVRVTPGATAKLIENLMAK